ncbi:NEL-type E3 ubiquitin ligase domain-containing protein [Pseudomonas sp. DWP1b1]|uniref:NEL-type E3 ubiquitin ligase domain-containing protein n=1 Tax=unclassified Pseudomonas TaxID=196821 RepID=UPI003CFA7376
MADFPSALPAATLSIHREYLEQASPAWLTDAVPARLAQIKNAPAPVPDWYRRATPAQRQALHEKFTVSFNAQTVLDKAMASVQDIDTFAEPLLVNALQAQFGVQLDVHHTLLILKKPVEIGLFGIDISSFEALRLPLLQAALHNFEASECEVGAFHDTSGFFAQTAARDNIEPVSTTLTVAQFTGLCRSLDIGAQYQRYLKGVVHSTDALSEMVLRRKFINARKADLAAAAQMALLNQDIEPADYRMILQVVNGEMFPRIGDKQVWFRDLGLMKKRMTGCVAFVISEKYRYSSEMILYVPHDPYHPLKRFTWDELAATFKQRFTTRDQPDPDDGSPTAYQRFFSQFVAYGDLPAYFNALTDDAPAPNVGSALAPYASLINELVKGSSVFSVFTGVRELPPVPARAKVPNPDPYLNPGSILIKGRGQWEDNPDLWQHLYETHRDKILADARSHAVPTADVDARVRSEKIAALLNIGMLVLNTVSMFVPVLGEVMMAVMASQLLYETFEGSVEWAEGDRRAAKAHLVDVAQNLAFLGVMAGIGKGVAALAAAKPEPLIEGLDPVVLPGGKTRLWKPDLQGYESPVTLPADVTPNAQGQYLQGGKTYIRQAGKVYEQAFDESAGRWRIQHPTDPDAYQPPLSHNGAGAWRHTLERPQAWDRLTLLRRMGHGVDRFSDEQLLKIAEISATSDATLRQMHLDNATPPAPLADALRLFRADQDVAQVIEQVSTGQAVDGRYLYSLPLLAEMPRWPIGRVLEVFDEPSLTGPAQRYGVERLYHGVKLKAPIRISRADVLSSQLPAHILAALDESEIVGMLGGEAARVRESRPQELRKQLAEYARTRQPALFDSLYKGTELPDPTVAKLQRLYPGLSEQAARSVLADADAEHLRRLHHTGRVPLVMQEHARWQASQGQMVRAYTGLHMENLISADSKRLALQTLSKLPGWSDQLRLEVRDGDITGGLLDSIGSDTAPQRKYLVKRGPQYQAFNERGEALNSLPRHGDNFYTSLMHAMPDEVRQALGVPHVGQSMELRRAIIDYATDHRVESAQVVEQAPSPAQWFKPPQRISSRLLGYPASGRGQGLSPSLVSRVQDVYPQLTEGQANGFIFQQMLAGKTEGQIYSLLSNRLREWQQLESTLDAWRREESRDSLVRQYPQMDSRPRLVQALKDCWRNAPLAELPGRAVLNLVGDMPLPLLSADFSHVRTLSLRGRRLIDGQIEQVLGYFPQVQALTLAGAETAQASVPRALQGMGALTRLEIETVAHLTEVELARLEGLGQLEELMLHQAVTPLRPLNVSGLARLRSLTLSGEGQREFPVQALTLAQLQRLDLKGAAVSSLPPELFEPGRERWWSQLSVNWSRFNREHFKRAYDYVKARPEHVMDQDEMVRAYCSGQLKDGFGRPRYTALAASSQLTGLFFRRWPSAQAQLDAIERLSNEFADFTRRLDAWQAVQGVGLEQIRRGEVSHTLRNSWYDGLMQRYGVVELSSSLGLPDLQVSELPDLTGIAFDHIRDLRLQNARVPSPQLSRFIRGLRGLVTLDLSGSGLSDLSLDADQWPALEHLNLRDTALETLDVAGLGKLQSLNLRGTRLNAWPNGAEQLPELTWLDLRDTRITDVPSAALAKDSLLLDTQLTGAPLSVQAQADLAAAHQRVEQALGMEDGTLSRFAQQPAPDAFPPLDSASSIVRQLLPASSGDPLENALVRRLNSWVFVRRYAPRRDVLVTPSTRRIAAQRILECWRAGLGDVPEGDARELNLHGLILGELPELPVALDHIERLNLNGVQLTGQGSNLFLRAFPEVDTLVLSSNALQALPLALTEMSRLERLELSGVGISDPELLYPTLTQLGNLRWLDLSYGNLETFRLDGFDNLQNLNLSNNELSTWPEGAFSAPSLRTLDLSGNQLESIPPQVLEGGHDALMAGVDLSDNLNLSLDDLHRLQQYAQRVGRDNALGLSSADIQQSINDLEQPLLSSGEEDAPDPAPAQPDEVLGDAHTSASNREPWLKNLPAEEQARRIELWDQLAQEPDNAAFFNLLSLLPQSKDFDAARAALTERVWRVMDAAASNTELRQTLFGMSSTHGTCTDGRILTFSGLEIKVLEFNTLNGIDPADLAHKGPALLSLSRNLFRLEQVEQLAARHIHAHSDPAEVRLQYLIGLKRRLDLKGVPQAMRYATPISGAAMEREARAIEALEKTAVFYEDLISRDYWVSYLKEQYPEDFVALEQRSAQQRDALEDAYASVTDEGYVSAAQTLEHQLQADQTQTLLALSRRTDHALNPAAHDPNLPGTSGSATTG